jgi:hypothetical protein
VRPRALRRRLTLAAFGAILAGATLGTGIAKADVITDYALKDAAGICAMLDQDPNTDGLKAVGAALMADGLTPEQAAAVTVLAVANVCPAHMPVLHPPTTAATTPTAANGHMGGVIT